ncbi:CaiB/BaiF CoA-transferase family protein [Nocardia cerradoensis]|uniref:Succinyl-CoA:(R)-benzylsuccinate CoA-transferase subunit BbsF n=1 Tax=Nocardia cerradoensis TaxID=85688 RepID=A0A231GUX5_9NOCA|nr:CoA transferase [Nocardia cerradoensis]NKY43642.1 CoA transferase [Nocardia cerradoensis]OXR40429.1 Succinyl-CoA:(R)-benzylsuccinate CoA-transferase subunit BbsF [Nocardia cerradoensis]
MGNSAGDTRLLSGLRVVESSRTIAGAYAGKLFADLGAEVLLAEPADGHPMRSANGSDQPSPLFSFLSAGKCSSTRHWRELVEAADVLVLETEGLPDLEELRRLARARVVVAVTPWGLAGPWAEAERPWTEFTLQAEAGSLSNRGNPHSYPVALGGSETLWVAGSLAATAAMGAVAGLDRSGVGELVDVSLLEATTYAATMFGDLRATIAGERPEQVSLRRPLLPSVEPAADGWVGFNLASAQNLEDFLVLIDRPDWLADEDMKTPEGRYRRGAEFSAAVRAWTRQHTVAEIIETASLFRIPCAPVHSAATILGDEHVRARDFYIDDATSRFRQPAVPMLFNGIRPGVGKPVSAPADVGFEGEPDRGRASATTEDDLPLRGLRVVDFSNWWVGPLVGTVLGSLGADVIKVESTRRVDGSRMLGGSATSRPDWWEYSWVYLGANHNKRGITLDISQPEGRELFERLIADADVLLENFAPRVLENVGLDWAAVHEINPSLVMLRMPAFGLTGPRRDMVGYAQTVEQYSGMCWRTGYPDGPPMNPSGPADPMGGSNAAFALLAALYRQTRDGSGLLVEAPLVEAALTMTAEQVVEFTANGRLLERDGNRSRGHGPQGVYAGAGTEQWLAVSVITDDQWHALAGYTGIAGWADPELSTSDGRWRHRDRLDADLAAWTAGRNVAATVADLIALGVPAAHVVDQRFVHAHPQIAARSYFEDIHHPARGTMPIPVLPFRFGRIPRWSRIAPPTVGEHNQEVLERDLGLSVERIRELAAKNVVGTRPLGL